jgi:hypothetical protein
MRTIKIITLTTIKSKRKVINSRNIDRVKISQTTEEIAWDFQIQINLSWIMVISQWLTVRYDISLNIKTLHTKIMKQIYNIRIRQQLILHYKLVKIIYKIKEN